MTLPRASPPARARVDHPRNVHLFPPSEGSHHFSLFSEAWGEAEVRGATAASRQNVNCEGTCLRPLQRESAQSLRRSSPSPMAQLALQARPRALE